MRENKPPGKSYTYLKERCPHAKLRQLERRYCLLPEGFKSMVCIGGIFVTAFEHFVHFIGDILPLACCRTVYVLSFGVEHVLFTHGRLSQTELNKRVKAIRGKEKVEINAFDIVVGDLIILEKGRLHILLSEKQL